MDHGTAENGKFTERYLLGDLDAAESAAFEEHYFECAVCARDVRLGARLVANLRVVFKEDLQGSSSEPPTIMIGREAKVLDLTIRMKTPDPPAPLDCVFNFAAGASPMVVTAMPAAGEIRLSLPVDKLHAGQCTVILREKDSVEELENHTFVFSKSQ